MLEKINSLDNASIESMVESINERMPAIKRATSNFGKRQSQFMDTMLTVSHPTPYRNMRQILSEIERSYEGLREAYYKSERRKIDLDKLRDDHKKAKYRLERRSINLEISEIESGLGASEKYIAGAIRKISNYMDQYNSILESIKKEHGVEELTEKDFEIEEEKYHIKTAYAQALSAARSRNGVIDEGNHIYLYQLGINGTVAQKYILDFMTSQQAMMNEGVAPPHSDIVEFLEMVYQAHKGCAKKYAEYKEMKLINESSFLKLNRDASYEI